MSSARRPPRPGKWSCTGPPDYDCIEDPDGVYPTREDCEEYCTLPWNTCHGCDPPIPDILLVTINGLGGSFEWANGEWELHWDAGCIWIHYDPDDRNKNIYISWRATVWALIVRCQPRNCYHQWYASDWYCDPRGYCFFWVCADGACGVHASCELSVGAEAYIEYPPGFCPPGRPAQGRRPNLPIPPGLLPPPPWPEPPPHPVPGPPPAPPRSPPAPPPT
ncbi:unnamed protein product [marine sediment metagenome]|uniref:Uncharacterized protein n=1 Tax=marine sediment metagenome TaxID=412755 RepID=X1IWC3_9ZZZZ